MREPHPHDTTVIAAAFRAALEQNWPVVNSLVNAYPHLLLRREEWAQWPIGYPHTMRSVQGWVTWGRDERAFVSLAPDESFARWIGYQAAAEDEKEFTWHGTQKLPCGHWAAQFIVADDF